MYLIFYMALGLNNFYAGKSITWALKGVGPENLSCGHTRIVKDLLVLTSGCWWGWHIASFQSGEW